MSTQRLAAMAATTTLSVLLLAGTAATGSAQVPKPMPDTMHKHQMAKGQKMEMPGMAGMPMGPHDALAMAYRDNLTTFARALQADVRRSKVVNLDLARPAVAEMRRSFDQLQTHHRAQMAMMNDQMKAQMMAKMQNMEQHLAAIGTHLGELEADLQPSTPDPMKVSMHTAAILSHCDGMMMRPNKGMRKE